MNKFLNELKRELEKRYASADVDDIVNFYQEVITDRIENGEDESLVIAGYDIDEIVKMSGPEVYSSKKEYKAKDARKGAASLTRILFSFPVTIPLGILYIVVLILIFSFAIAGIAIGISGVAMIVYAVVGLFIHNASPGITIGTIGAVLIGVTIAIFVCMMCMKASKAAGKGILKLSSKIIRKRKYNESNI